MLTGGSVAGMEDSFPRKKTLISYFLGRLTRETRDGSSWRSWKRLSITSQSRISSQIRKNSRPREQKRKTASDFPKSLAVSRSHDEFQSSNHFVSSSRGYASESTTRTRTTTPRPRTAPMRLQHVGPFDIDVTRWRFGR